MKYCTKCGQQVEDNAAFCSSCGSSFEVEKKVEVVQEKKVEYSSKSKVLAGLLQILFGSLGIGRFYSGHIGVGVAQILVTFFTCGVGGFWGRYFNKI